MSWKIDFQFKDGIKSFWVSSLKKRPTLVIDEEEVVREDGTVIYKPGRQHWEPLEIGLEDSSETSDLSWLYDWLGTFMSSWATEEQPKFEYVDLKLSLIVKKDDIDESVVLEEWELTDVWPQSMMFGEQESIWGIDDVTQMTIVFRFSDVRYNRK